MKHILANEIRRDYGADPFVSKLALQLADLLEMDNAKGKMFNQIITNIRKDERKKILNIIEKHLMENVKNREEMFDLICEMKEELKK